MYETKDKDYIVKEKGGGWLYLPGREPKFASSMYETKDEEIKMGRPGKYDQTAPFILVAYMESESQRSRKSGAAQRGKDESYDVAVPGLTKQMEIRAHGVAVSGVRCSVFGVSKHRAYEWLCPGTRGGGAG